jgi:hypothetical protein
MIGRVISASSNRTELGEREDTKASLALEAYVRGLPDPAASPRLLFEKLLGYRPNRGFCARRIHQSLAIADTVIRGNTAPMQNFNIPILAGFPLPGSMARRPHLHRPKRLGAESEFVMR